MSAELHTALRVAFRHIDAADTTRTERESVLSAMVSCLPDREAELAAQSLHHLREGRKAQMTLKAIIDGSTEGDGNGSKKS